MEEIWNDSEVFTCITGVYKDKSTNTEMLRKNSYMYYFYEASEVDHVYKCIQSVYDCKRRRFPYERDETDP